MKLSKMSLLFIAAFFMLALPLSFTAGTASAAQFVHNDGAARNANGGYELPKGVCVGANATTPDTDADGVPNAVTLSDTTDVACQADAVAAGVTLLLQGPCQSNGFSWSSRHGCSNNWNVTNPDTGVLYSSDATISGNQGCLRCHNSDYMTAGAHDPLAAKERYLLTGHRNMVRKTTNAATTYLPDGTTLAAGAAINLGGVDWTTTNSTVPGFPIVSGAASYGLASNIAYEWGGWWGNKKVAQILRQPEVPQAPSTVKVGANSYATCSQCHTTGWDVPGASSTPTQTDQPPAGLIQTSNTWIYEGIQCSRCHDHSADSAEPEATDYTSSHNNGTLYENEQSTQLCFQCHTQESPINAGNVSQLVIGGHSGYAAAFAGHYRTNQFLNSPHARFTGTEGQVGNGANYASKWNAGTCSDSFLTNKTDCTTAGDTWTSLKSDNNGCVACHDVHTSSVDPDVMDPTNSTDSNIKAGAMCGTACHSYIKQFNHPVAPGTPLDGDLTTAKGKMKACVTCHMGGSSASKVSHLFRINPDADYVTFPTSAQFAAGQLTANTYDEGDGYPAVAADVNLACGQCHGGNLEDGTNAPGTPVAGAPYFSQAQLNTLAENMHNTYPTNQNFTATSGSASYQVNFAASAASCPSGVDSCTYAWDFGDGATGAGAYASHTYSTTKTAPVTVTMTVNTSAHTSGTVSKIVTPSATASAATNIAAIGAQSLASNGMGVSFTDASTDDTAGVTDTIYVNWGDGSPMASGAKGSLFQHTYTNSGTYTIVHKIRDTAGFSAQETKTVTMSTSGGGVVTNGSLTITSAGTAGTYVTYYVKHVNANTGLTQTVLSGYVVVPNGATITTLPAGPDYSMTFYGSGGTMCSATLDSVSYTAGSTFTLGTNTVAITCN
jgi:hypothetical protein